MKKLFFQLIFCFVSFVVMNCVNASTPLQSNAFCETTLESVRRMLSSRAAIEVGIRVLVLDLCSDKRPTGDGLGCRELQ